MSVKTSTTKRTDFGKPDMEKMNLVVFGPIHRGYIKLGKLT